MARAIQEVPASGRDDSLAGAAADRGPKHGRREMRVLLAGDSPTSIRIAEDWVVRLRWALAPFVDVLVVTRPRRLLAGLGLQTYREAVSLAVADLRQADLMDGLRLANSVGERLQSAGFRTRAWARHGDLESEVGPMARNERPDLLIVGKECRARRFWRQEPADELAVELDVPILIVRAAREGIEPLPRHIVAANEGARSDFARDWLKRAGWLADAQFAEPAPADRSGLVPQTDLAVAVAPDGRTALDSLELAPAVLQLPRPGARTRAIT